MSDEQERQDKRQEAMEWVGKAYQLHMKGEVAKAIGFYTKSIEICPTAEAYTFRGWARSFEKDYAAAIEDCHRAIDLDPEFGNPYNDIGAYYVEQGEPDEAIPWLRMALKAERYESYCYPHMNLGRVYELKRDWIRAKEEYKLALNENKDYKPAAEGLARGPVLLRPICVGQALRQKRSQQARPVPDTPAFIIPGHHNPLQRILHALSDRRLSFGKEPWILVQGRGQQERTKEIARRQPRHG